MCCRDSKTKEWKSEKVTEEGLCQVRCSNYQWKTSYSTVEKYMWTWRIAAETPEERGTRNGSSAIQCFERGDAIETYDKITFNFYTGLPHIYIPIYSEELLINVADTWWKTEHCTTLSELWFNMYLLLPIHVVFYRLLRLASRCLAFTLVTSTRPFARVRDGLAW